MGISVNTNLAAITSARNVGRLTAQLEQSMERLSSGLRINKAADDAAGMGIAARMRGTLSGLEQAERNSQDAISMVQTSDGAMAGVQQVLTRVRDLALQFQNGAYSAADRASITAEVAQLSTELGRIISSTSFNGISLLGGAGIAATFQIGTASNDTLALNQIDVGAAVGSVVSDFVTGTVDLDALGAAIDNVTNSRSSLGAIQNRLQVTIDGLGTYRDNLLAAKSRIEDVDMAEEMATLTRLQIRQQAGVAMLAQANQAPSIALSLLR